jgi:hypothetical protein
MSLPCCEPNQCRLLEALETFNELAASYDQQCPRPRDAITLGERMLIRAAGQLADEARTRADAAIHDERPVALLQALDKLHQASYEIAGYR